jgi:hypothetical protein
VCEDEFEDTPCTVLVTLSGLTLSGCCRKYSSGVWAHTPNLSTEIASTFSLPFVSEAAGVCRWSRTYTDIITVELYSDVTCSTLIDTITADLVVEFLGSATSTRVNAYVDTPEETQYIFIADSPLGPALDCISDVGPLSNAIASCGEFPPNAVAAYGGTATVDLTP